MPILSRENLKGIWGTVLLPINSDDSIDYECIQDEINLLCRSGIDGLYSNGTAGEFYNQTENEFDLINQLMAEICHKWGMPFQIGASHMSPQISLERIKRAKPLQPHAFQIILPDWVVTNSEEQITFLKKIADAAAPIPLVLYHPGHAKTKLSPLDFKHFSEEIPELIGIKVAAGGAEWYSQMRSAAIPLSVFVPGHRLATGVKETVGAGAYSNVACINPVATKNWYQLMLENIGEALLVEQRILLFFERCIIPFHTAGYTDMALDKFLAAVGGWSGIDTRLRWPYHGIDKGEIHKVRKIGQEILPEFFVEQ
jgi:4-hydroxy-tetrahydrodipicolinate synthase